MTTKLIHEFPKFYIKSVGGNFTITHRLTHSYIESVDTEDEVVDMIEELNSLSELELWVYLLDVKKVSVPSPKETNYKEKDSSEEWFRSAWNGYTDRFYTDYPELYDEVKVIPYEVINKIRRDRYEIERSETLAREVDRRKAEEAFNQSEKKLRKVEEVSEGKIGSVGSIEKMKQVKKKGIRKLKVKTKSGKAISIVDSNDPFA